MNSHRSGVFAARWIIPVSSPPINGGWIRIAEGTIAEVRGGAPPTGAIDLGDVAILPRLVNAHTHLEFSGLDGPIGEAGNSLARWIGLVVASRASGQPASRDEAIRRGLAELQNSGTVLAGEISTPPCNYPPGAEIPELVRYAEVLGLSAQRADERIASAMQMVDSSPRVGLSPHAPYSITRSALEQVLVLARQHRLPVAMHVAESPEERELLAAGTGPLREALQSLGVLQEGLFPWGPDPFNYLIDRLASARSVLLIHGNDLNDGELRQVRRYDHVTVVYCPRTHHFFQFKRHPVSEMIACGIRVALGTDSRASNPDLNLWREVQFLIQRRTDLDPADVIRMATLNGAEALGCSCFGAIERDRVGLLGFVPTQASSLTQLYEDFAVRDYYLVEGAVSLS